MSVAFEDGRALIQALRGIDDGALIECCACPNRHPVEEMIPEEAGDWICRPCNDRWAFWDAWAMIFGERVAP